MPELPEVETIRRQLADEVIGKTIESVWEDWSKMLRPSPDEFTNAVVGATITDVKRRAKLLVFQLDSSRIFTTHLKMTGRLLYRSLLDEPDPYTHVLFNFTDGTQLRFTDARKFGFLELLPSHHTYSTIVNNYGPEILDDLDCSIFAQILTSSNRRIKDLLLDQTKIAGIGNIYANDGLWMAYIHPERSSSSLSDDEITALHTSLEHVIQEGLDTGGASDNWYVQLHGEKGSYQERFKAYGRKGQPCSRHPDVMIEYLKVGQRGTFVCPVCQQLG